MIHFNPRPERNEEYRFELCRPLTGKPPHNKDLPPSAPPYDPIGYEEGYSAMDPLGEDGELSIHPTTGVMTYTGDRKGSYVVAVCIYQYKAGQLVGSVMREDRKSTRLNSSHVAISYAVFCLKKKKRVK